MCTCVGPTLGVWVCIWLLSEVCGKGMVCGVCGKGMVCGVYGKGMVCGVCGKGMVCGVCGKGWCVECVVKDGVWSVW